MALVTVRVTTLVFVPVQFDRDIELVHYIELAVTVVNRQQPSSGNKKADYAVGCVAGTVTDAHGVDANSVGATVHSHTEVVSVVEASRERHCNRRTRRRR